MSDQAEPDFMRIQRALAAWLRAPEASSPPPGIAPERAGVYRRLVQGNIRAAIKRGFPVIYKLLDEDRWQALVAAFIAEHRAETPLFRELGGEFVAWLAGRAPDDRYPPFLAELADYEWLEVMAARAPAKPACDVDAEGNLMAGLPVVNPTAALRLYQWPVHRIAPDYQPQTPPETPTGLVVFRDRQDRVRFHQLAPFLLTLLDLFGDPDAGDTKTILRQVGEDMGRPPEGLYREAAAALERLREADILLGIRC